MFARILNKARHPLRSVGKDRRGNVLVLTAAALPVMIGGAGLGVDVTQWYLWQRELQMSVDTAALAGAYSKVQGKDYNVSANAALTDNKQVLDYLGTPSVTVVSWSGGTNNAVRVSAQTQRDLPFSSLFLPAGPTITATATAAVIDSGEFCMLATNETAQAAVSIGGNALLQLGCGIATNSNHSEAIKIFGSSQVDADPLTAMGGITAGSNNLIGDTTTRPYSVKQTDPLAHLTTPPAGTSRTYDKNNATLQPGTYSDMQIKGSHTLAPGVYTIDGGSLKVAAQYNLSGSGVIFVLKNGATIDINGGSNISFTAPTSDQITASPGTYNNISSEFGGVLIFEDKATSVAGKDSRINGNATLHLGGAIYMPNQDMEMTGNASPSTQCLLLIANTIGISGNPIIPNSCPPGSSPPGNFGAKVVRLVS
ncbi:hypothetical protein BSL82_02065 [Tardibacter chloracetimidivorans]|uniref:Putative Flp pilus-assembly TadG-like N-terminal domain-containing protein n=1 Tax=Tardibacter chloracetimidivorans TaxID=1921510 RepID=A0A1L3ZRI2_9SPHN|nr:TadE/TadG family type IV pilus assembly protein [Tardibacter chloracetimidivorans]API58236.1 hypothetical protein BSL82_02065 [Tardibacter chloracetimidivorans]